MTDAIKTRLDEIRARMDAATPGPWCVREHTPGAMEVQHAVHAQCEGDTFIRTKGNAPHRFAVREVRIAETPIYFWQHCGNEECDGNCGTCGMIERGLADLAERDFANMRFVAGARDDVRFLLDVIDGLRAGPAVKH